MLTEVYPLTALETLVDIPLNSKPTHYFHRTLSLSVLSVDKLENIEKTESDTFIFYHPDGDKQIKTLFSTYSTLNNKSDRIYTFLDVIRVLVTVVTSNHSK